MNELQTVGSISIPEGFEFVARWPTSAVDLAYMAKLYGEDARCCAPGPAGGLPLIIRPTPSAATLVAETPPPAPLSAERLSEIRDLQAVWNEYADAKPWRAASNTPRLATTYASELLTELDRVNALLASAEERATRAEAAAVAMRRSMDKARARVEEGVQELIRERRLTKWQFEDAILELTPEPAGSTPPREKGGPHNG